MYVISTGGLRLLSTPKGNVFISKKGVSHIFDRFTLTLTSKVNAKSTDQLVSVSEKDEKEKGGLVGTNTESVTKNKVSRTRNSGIHKKYNIFLDSYLPFQKKQKQNVAKKEVLNYLHVKSNKVISKVGIIYGINSF